MIKRTENIQNNI